MIDIRSPEVVPDMFIPILHKIGLGRLLAVVTTALLPGCGSESLASDPVSVADSAGIRIVESREGKWGGEDTWSVPADPMLTIGVLDGSEEYQFSRVSSAGRQADGDFVIADAGSRTVRLYDSAGVFKRLLGGPGSGPGEFRRPTQVLILTSDSILVWDDAEYRLTRFDSAGEFAGVHSFSRETIAKAVTAPLYPGAGLLMSDGGLLVRLIEKSGDLPDSSPFRNRSGALRVSSDEASIDTLMWFGDVEQVLVDAPWGPHSIEPPIAKNTSIAVQPAGPRLCIGDQEGPQVRCFDREGPATTIRWANEPIPIRDGGSETAEWREMMLELYEPKLTRDDARQLLAQVPAPAVRQVYSGLMLDTEGNLWVLRGPGAPGQPPESEYLVFDPAGELLGSTIMPSARILDIGPDYVIGVSTDEFEVEYVQVFSIVKPESSP